MAQSQSYIGLEFGSSATKIVEIRKDETGPTLVTYGIAEHDRALVKKDARENSEQLASSLNNALSLAHVSSDRIVAALPSMNVFHTILEIPPMPEKDIASAIQWEAKRVIPLPLDKMTLDWHVLSSGNNSEQEKIKIILTAAPTDLIHEYVNIIKTTGLRLMSLESEINALQRSLLPGQPGRFLVLDLGTTNTNMVIFENHIPIQVRNISVGTDALNIQISNAMNISLDKVTTIRNEIGIPLKETPHPAGKAILFVMNTLIINEIQRFIQPFRSGNTPVEHIILTGGGALLKNSAQYFGQTLGIATSVGDPWQHVNYHPDLTETLKAIGPRMAVVIGLALKK